ncbi:unnamed protein product, partial [Ectocarpus sp. 8 AP-2014]
VHISERPLPKPPLSLLLQSASIRLPPYHHRGPNRSDKCIRTQHLGLSRQSPLFSSGRRTDATRKDPFPQTRTLNHTQYSHKHRRSSDDSFREKGGQHHCLL